MKEELEEVENSTLDFPLNDPQGVEELDHYISLEELEKIEW